MLHAGSTTRNAGIADLYRAKDLVEDTRMWDHDEGGSKWKVSSLDSSNSGPKLAPGSGAGWKNFAGLVKAHHSILLSRTSGDARADKPSPLEILEDVNVLQRQLDMLTRRKKHFQSLLFAEWWKRIATKEVEKGTAQSLMSMIKTLDDGLASLQVEIAAKIKELEIDYKVPCEKTSAGRFHIPKEPSLIVAGIPNPRPWDYGEPLPVRLHSQVLDSIVPDKTLPWPGFKAFMHTLDSRKFLSPDFHPDVGRSILGEFEVLRNVGSKVYGSPSHVGSVVKSPSTGTFPHYYNDPEFQFSPPGTGGFQIVTSSLDTQSK